MKLVVNAYVAALIEGLAEARLIGWAPIAPNWPRPSRVDPSMHDLPTPKLHKMERGDFDAEFPLEWALKDVNFALLAANNDRPPMLSVLSHQWRAAVDHGHAREDVSAARLALSSHE